MYWFGNQCYGLWIGVLTQQMFLSLEILGGSQCGDGSCTDRDRKVLRSVVRFAEFILDRKLPALQDTYHTRCLRKAGRIQRDCYHQSFSHFTPLLSGRQYWSIRSCTRRQGIVSFQGPSGFWMDTDTFSPLSHQPLYTLSLSATGCTISNIALIVTPLSLGYYRFIRLV